MSQIDMKQDIVTFVLFGGTGDLAKRKLVPAFAKLVQKEILAKTSIVIGIGRKDLTDTTYKQYLTEGLHDAEKKIVQDMQIRFFQADVTQPGSLQRLQSYLENLEPKEGAERVYYLATSYTFFPVIVNALKEAGIAQQKKRSTRIVFEKPFGSDLASSDDIDRRIHAVFSEDDIFRIDHYLAKDTVQNLHVLKFANPFFNSLLRKECVDRIEIIVDEELGVGNRIGYYAEAGAIKDMIQNHLLQTLALLLMEQPKTFDAKHIHDEKVNILENLQVAHSEKHLLGQYRSYTKEAAAQNIQNVNSETFAKITLTCATGRWKGVTITLRTGKKLTKKYGQIKITFKQATKNVENTYPTLVPNVLLIDIHPFQDINLIVNARKPHTSNRTIVPIKLAFSQKSAFGPNTSDEYAVLLEEVCKGDKTLFTRFDEVRASWRIIWQIETIKKRIPFVIYPDGTDPETVAVRQESSPKTKTF